MKKPISSFQYLLQFHLFTRTRRVEGCIWRVEKGVGCAHAFLPRARLSPITKGAPKSTPLSPTFSRLVRVYKQQSTEVSKTRLMNEHRAPPSSPPRRLAVVLGVTSKRGIHLCQSSSPACGALFASFTTAAAAAAAYQTSRTQSITRKSSVIRVRIDSPGS